jgi:hypothetical protein
VNIYLSAEFNLNIAVGLKIKPALVLSTDGFASKQLARNM